MALKYAYQQLKLTFEIGRDIFSISNQILQSVGKKYSSSQYCKTVHCFIFYLKVVHLAWQSAFLGHFEAFQDIRNEFCVP